MTQRQLRWHQPLSFLAIGGILFIASHSAIIQGTGVANAQLQLIADDTLGNERSIVSPNQVINGLPSNAIDGGARRGADLFHSFREFNIDVGRGVYFTNPAGVTNILTRVTGGNPSQILGTLGVLGNANLFLLNPKGILFGPNARLALGGSFVASTANSLVFNNGFAFSATDPQVPPLLTVNVPIGLQYGSNPGAIQSQGAILQVPTGQTLTLAGGTVNVDGGQLRAPGGRVELAGVAAPGEVGLAQQGQEWRLSVAEGLARADVAIGDANVNVRSGGGGSIDITARNLTITETLLGAGIATGVGTVGAQAGDVNIDTAEAVNIDSDSLVSNEVQRGGTGNAGNVTIITGALLVTNGAQVSANTFGQGNAGNVTITARDLVSFDGVNNTGFFSSAAVSSVELGAIGQGGDIRITTGSLSFTNGGFLDTTTLGQGDAGNIIIAARDTVSFDGAGGTVNSSTARSTVSARATGQGGDISITTGSLSMTNGAVLIASTFGRGDAGNITITARDAVSFDNSAVFSSVAARAIGQGGDIRIATGLLSVTNGAEIIASTRGQGDAGNITITAKDTVSFDGVGSNGFASGAISTVASGVIGRGGDINITTGSLSVTKAAVVQAGTRGQGKSGNINITARDAVFFDSDGSAFSSVEFGAIGQGGNIRITTDVLSVFNGAQVVASTSGRGDAGNIFITARDAVSFDGTDSAGLNSGAFSSVLRGAIGQGGDIRIAANKLSLTKGGVVNAATSGRGNAGNITITARDAVSIDGVGSNGLSSGAVSSVGSGAIGQGGRVTVETGLFSITNGGQLSASSRGEGRAGNLDVNARQLRLDNQGSIQAQTASGQGGNITLQVQDYLLLRRDSFISTTAGTAQAGGDGGNITFKGNFIVAVANENSDISANAFTGKGGRVDITAQGLFGIQFRPQLTPLSDITASSDFGVAGVVAINTPDVDPNRGLVQLPVDLTDASRLIVQTCPTGDSLAKQPNEFIITGRGGLPPTPSEAVNRDAIQVDLVTADRENPPAALSNNPTQRPPASNPQAPIVEAQALQVAADGTPFLVAANSTMTRVPSLHRSPGCWSLPLSYP